MHVYYLINIGRETLRHVFAFQSPFHVISLYGHSYSIETVLTVYFVNSFGQRSSLFTVHGIEQISLYGTVVAYIPYYHTGLLIVIAAGTGMPFVP